MSFIEVLVAIVLLGVAVVSVLVALRTTTLASKTDAEHARASAYLQDASDAIFERLRVPCTDPDILSKYRSTVVTVPPPQGWPGVTVQVTMIEFLTSPDPDATTFTWGTECREGVTIWGDYTDYPLLSQKVTLEVTSPDGDFTKTLETVKVER